MNRLAAAVLLLSGVGLAQDAQPPQDQRLEWLVTLDSYHPWTPPPSAEAWALRRDQVRRQVLVAAGLWPEPFRCELQAVVHGSIERQGYTVEKVYFQSLPGFYVTGNLYRPKSAGPHPGVLCPHGHWSGGRFSAVPDADAVAQIERGQEAYLANARYHLQARCAQLARMGCVVFHYDMIGYGDSTQLEHRSGFGDVEAELWGMSWFGLQTLDSIRALDFLLSLDDVDPEHIAVTGGSGGGTQTFILGAVDDRPDVLFPAVMVSTAMQGGCVCENASHLRVGSGNIELAALAAPRPLGLTGAQDWTVEIETRGLPELKRLYTMLEVPGAVAAWCHPEFPHNYNRISRGHLYHWLNRHLTLGLVEPIDEPPLVPVVPQDLSVFDEDHPRPAGARDLAGVRASLRGIAGQELDRLADAAASDPEEFRRVVGGALRAMIHSSLPAPGRVEHRVLERRLEPGLALTHLTLSRAGSGERLDAVLAMPEPWNGTVVVRVAPLDPDPLAPGRGGEAQAPDLDLRASGQGAAELLVRPLLVGRSGSLPVDGGRHRSYVGYTYGYNPTLLAQRVHDILTAVAYARDLERARRVRLWGRGAAGPWVLLAAALAGGAVDRVAAEPTWDFDAIDSVADPNLLPGALRWGGLPFFTALVAPAELAWVSERPVPEVVRAHYGAQGRPRAVEAAGPSRASALPTWLAAETP